MGRKPAQRRVEALNLAGGAFIIHYLGRSQMTEHALQSHLRQTFHAVGKRFQLGQRQSQATHARVDLQMDRNLPIQSQACSRLRQCLGIFQAKDRWSQRIPHSLLFFAREQSAHYQDAPGNPGLAQDNAFVGRGNSKPLRACLLQRWGALFHAVSVRVTLDHSTNGHVWAEVGL